MEQLITYAHEMGELRTLEIDGEPWFVGKDVADILKYSNTAKAIRDHVDEEDKLTERFVLSGQNREIIVINESGLYSLILSSKLETAKIFKRWVTSEVLPSIRKNGMYATPTKAEELLNDPDLFIGLLEKYKVTKQANDSLLLENTQLSVKNIIMQPKSDYFDELVDRNLLTGFRETAKQFDIKEKVFIQFLIDKKYIYRNKKGKLVPYSGKGDGLFSTKECFNDKTSWSGTQTLITPKGRETFRLLLCGY